MFEKINGNSPDNHMAEQERVLAKARVFRNNVQSFFFQKAVEAFVQNYEAIMHGEFRGELLDVEKGFTDVLKKITSNNCFSCKEVLSLELAGHKVITELLNIFYDVLNTATKEEVESTKEYASKIYSKISENYKYIALHDYTNNDRKDFDKLTTYDKLHLIVDFVSGMTDSYAVSLYKELTGISLPE